MIHRDSNIDDIIAWYRGTAETFGFTVPGVEENRSLGETLVDEIVDGIYDRSYADRGAPSTGTWPENEEKYKRRKLRLYGVGETNSRTGQMLSRESLRGCVTVTKDLVTITYGTGEPPRSGSTGYISDQDKEITDDDKAFYAQEQGRGFYELDDDICDNVLEAVSTTLGDFMKRAAR